jgi:hypothetical protein
MNKALKIIGLIFLLFIGIFAWRKINYKKSAYKRESNNANCQAVRKAEKKLMPCMLVFRRGADGISDLFSKMNQKDQTFSHCGILLNDQDSLWIYHSIGGEDNPDQVIKKENFVTFTHPQNNLGFGLMQFPFTIQEQFNLDSIIKKWYAEKRTFDMDFKLDNDERKMYCVEFIYKAIQLAKNDSTYFSTSKAKDFVYVAPDDILLHKDGERIIEKMYE